MPGHSDAPPKGPTELGGYVLLRELGRGAIGIVHAAYHEGLDRKLAIKVLNRARAGRPDLEARLRREARSLARLSHPNVVQVYDVGEIDGRVFVVMEFVEGRSLREWMREGHPQDEILALFAGAGRGLAAAHAAGVVHRDFKPDNVIVGRDGRPRVLDFGLAREVADDEAGAEARGPEAVGLAAEPAGGAEAAAAEPAREHETNVDSEDEREDQRVDDRTRAGPPARLSARQIVASRDGGDEHLNVRTRDPSSSDHGTVVGYQDEFEVTMQSEPGDPIGAEILTRTGVRLGTPAYMSPEQFMAKPADHRSDQFGFCVALHEAVYGRRPYPAKNQADLHVQVHSGKILPAPPDSPVPLWLREIIVRGLSPRPEDRWPSMDELIVALEHRPEPPRRRGLIALAVVGVATVALVIGLMSPTPEPGCPTTEEAAAQLWTPERASTLADAFSGSGPGYADAVWTNVDARLSSWTLAWAREQVSACEATQSQREPSTADMQLLDRRSACLDRSRRSFEALVAQFRVADRGMVERAVEAVAALPDPARCGELDTLTNTLALPPAEHAEEIAELRNQLTELDTRVATGGWESALPSARTAVERARATGHGPVITEALMTQGRLLAQSSQASDEALTSLQDALDQADRSGHHQLVPRIATELVSLSIYAKPDPTRGRLWARRALTGLDRLEREQSEHPDALALVRARGVWALGNLERLDGDYEHAVQHIGDALALLATHAPTHPDRGIMLNDLGNALAARGDVASARAAYEQAVRESIAAFGAGHPRVGNAHFNLAWLAMAGDELEQAREQADLAFIIFAGAYGLDHRDVGAVEILRAGIELRDGNIDAARERARRAQVIYDAVLAVDNVDRAEPHQMLGHVAHAAEDYEQARLHYRAALAIKRAALPPGHIELVPTLTNLGLIQSALGERADKAGAKEVAATEYEAAAVDLEQALVLLEDADGVDPQQLRQGRLFLADVLIRLETMRHRTRAAAEYEAGLRDCPIDEVTCAKLAVGASDAWQRLDERERARARGAEAKARLDGLDPNDKEVVEARQRLDALPSSP
jgi:serine/threonine protein kinase/tetratricopeptide (TPR) repeat protein